LLIYNRIDEYIFAPNRITLLKKKTGSINIRHCKFLNIFIAYNIFTPFLPIIF
jgi:hypothetical protein